MISWLFTLGSEVMLYPGQCISWPAEANVLRGILSRIWDGDGNFAILTSPLRNSTWRVQFPEKEAEIVSGLVNHLKVLYEDCQWIEERYSAISRNIGFPDIIHFHCSKMRVPTVIKTQWFNANIKFCVASMIPQVLPSLAVWGSAPNLMS